MKSRFLRHFEILHFTLEVYSKSLLNIYCEDVYSELSTWFRYISFWLLDEFPIFQKVFICVYCHFCLQKFTRIENYTDTNQLMQWDSEKKLLHRTWGPSGKDGGLGSCLVHLCHEWDLRTAFVLEQIFSTERREKEWRYQGLHSPSGGCS